MRVLIIDDSKTMRNIVKSAIAPMKPTALEEAGDGQDALNKAAVFKPDLVLCDWNMPIMDGITFVRHYRAKGNRCPIVMVTTEAEKTRVIEAIKAGVNNYVVKPFTPDDIQRVLRVTMDKYRAAAA
jgi:two-component system chemotaxis response regulator CheY